MITTHLAFPISEPVKSRAEAIIAEIRAHENPKVLAGKLTDVIIAMTEEGLQFLFVDSLVHAKVPSFQIKAVQMGVNTARKGLELVGRRVLKGMGNPQLKGIVDYMEFILLEVEE